MISLLQSQKILENLRNFIKKHKKYILYFQMLKIFIEKKS